MCTVLIDYRILLLVLEKIKNSMFEFNQIVYGIFYFLFIFWVNTYFIELLKIMLN